MFKKIKLKSRCLWGKYRAVRRHTERSVLGKVVRISTRTEETFEQRPTGKEQASPLRGWEEHSGRWEAVMPSVQYLGPDISKNSSRVISAMSFLKLSITCSERIQKCLPHKTVISTLIYYASLSASSELLISSSNTTSSQDLSDQGCSSEFPRHCQSTKCVPFAPDFITCYPSAHCRHLSGI